MLFIFGKHVPGCPNVMPSDGGVCAYIHMHSICEVQRLTLMGLQRIHLAFKYSDLNFSTARSFSIVSGICCHIYCVYCYKKYV